jgi:hypothetical protein
MYSMTVDVTGAKEALAFVSPERLASDMAIVHRKIALKLLAYIIQTMPVDTGRARAGWTALMDKSGLSSQALIARGGGNLDSRAIAEGKALSKIHSDRPFNIIVGNAVSYVEYLDRGTATIRPMRFVTKAIYRAQRNARAVIDAYVASREADANFRPKPESGDLD